MLQHDTEVTVAGDQVAFQRVGDAVAIGTDEIILGNVDAHPFHLHTDAGRAGGIRADAVAGDAVVVAAVDAGAGELDIVGVAADHVAFQRVAYPVAVRADDGVAGFLHQDTVGRNRLVVDAHGRRARCIQANIVTHDQVAGGGGLVNPDVLVNVG